MQTRLTSTILSGLNNVYSLSVFGKYLKYKISIQEIFWKINDGKTYLVISTISGLGVVIYHISWNFLSKRNQKNTGPSFDYEDIPGSIYVWGCLLTGLTLLPYWRNYPLRRFCLRYLRNTFNGLWTWTIIMLNFRNRRQNQQSTGAVLFKRTRNTKIRSNHDNYDVEIVELPL